MKYLLIFLLVLVIFVASVTLGAHNDQVVTFNYLLLRANILYLPCWPPCLVLALCWGGLFVGYFICAHASLLGVQSGKSKGWNCSSKHLSSRHRCPQSARNNLLC
ncbi:Inner membrane protein yciS [Serratia fonticola]|uniref:Inner membrane protein yciS n=1 Tax=Serratia fonticola TaxID=47917 RepID=A0A4U9USS1_SERFO|nr:Inner membrane protein yciS [Serratia fonticola]